MSLRPSRPPHKWPRQLSDPTAPIELSWAARPLDQLNRSSSVVRCSRSPRDSPLNRSSQPTVRRGAMVDGFFGPFICLVWKMLSGDRLRKENREIQRRLAIALAIAQLGKWIKVAIVWWPINKFSSKCSECFEKLKSLKCVFQKNLFCF